MTTNEAISRVVWPVLEVTDDIDRHIEAVQHLIDNDLVNLAEGDLIGALPEKNSDWFSLHQRQVEAVVRDLLEDGIVSPKERG